MAPTLHASAGGSLRPQQLQAGAVPAGTRRLATTVVILLGVAARVAAHLSGARVAPDSPVSLRDLLLSADWPWIDPPLPPLVLALSHLAPRPEFVLLGLELVAALIVIVALLRLGERWLDFDAAVLGAGLWAMCGPAVAVMRVPGTEGWQAALSILAAASMLQVARRRAPQEAWRIGASAGALTLFSGGGILWALASIAWLPLTSQRFRGTAWLRTAALVLAAWLVVVLPVAVRNAAVGGGDPKLPGAGDVARLHIAAVDASVAAPSLAAATDSAGVGPVSARYATQVLMARGLPTRAPEWSRATNLLTVTLEQAAADGGRGWQAVGRRVLASVGGWSAPLASDLPLVPWAWIAFLAWVGVVALLPGFRQFVPLLLGGVIPLVQSAAMGIDVGTVIGASPFVCLFAGYGAWRIWTGRRWLLTWMVAPVILGAALLLHLAVRGWS